MIFRRVSVRLSRALLGGAVLVAVLAGCSDDPTGPATNGPETTTAAANPVPDPCALLDKAQVEAAVGGPLSDGVSDLMSKPGFDATGRQCSFRTTGGKDGGFNLTIWPATAEMFALDRTESAGFGNVEDAPGIGDQAFTVGNNGLHVLAGGYLLELGIGQVDFDPDKALQFLEDIAKAVIAKL
jgi:hypothetical protein